MNNRKKPKETRWHGSFRLDLSAVEIEGVWYPEFAISRCDGFVIPWQRPATGGYTSEAEALNSAATLAIAEANYWREVTYKLKLL